MAQQKKPVSTILLLVLFSLLGACADKPDPSISAPDTVYINAVIYTVNSSQPWAKSLAVSGPNISCLSETDSCADAAGPETNIVDLYGQFMLPGLHDTHTHIMMGGALSSGMWLNLFDSPGKEQTLQLIDAHAQTLGPGEWVIASGYKYDHFPDGVTRQELDVVTYGRPAIVSSDTQHTGWYNTKALAELGVDANTPDPSGGEFTREASGFPTGEAKEMAHQSLGMNMMVAGLSSSKRRTVIKSGTGVYNSLGITSYVNALTEPGLEVDFQQLASAGELSARVQLNLLYQPQLSVEENIENLRQRSFLGDEMLRGRTVKFVTDGVIGSTAAMGEPYADGSYGLPIFTEQQLIDALRAVSANNLRIYLHACGDAPVSWALEAIRQAREQGQYDPDMRHTFTHLDYVTDGQIAEMARYGINGSVSPAWATENYFMHLVKQMMPDERYHNLYKFREMADSGVMLSGGADWPTTPDVDPLVYIQSAITREHPLEKLGRLDGGGLSLEETLRMYTIDGAYQMQQEDITGSLEVGKRADLVVLDKNLFEIEVEDIHRVRVLLTVLNGGTVYRRP